MASLQYLLGGSTHLLADSSFSPQLFDYRQLLDANSSFAPKLDNASLRKLQKAYFSTDVNIVLTNTFDANRFKLSLLGLSDQCQRINEGAARQTRMGIIGHERHVAVAGNIGPCGTKVSHAEAINGYAEQAEALARGGIDCLWLEAFSSAEMIDAAITGCEIGAPQLPIIVTFSFTEGDRIPIGVLPIASAKTACPRKQVIAIGADTGAGSLNTVQTLHQLRMACPEAVLVSKVDLNSAEIESAHENNSRTSVDAVADFARKSANAGARIIATCRDATPDHLNAMSLALRKPERTNKSPYNNPRISRNI